MLVLLVVFIVTAPLLTTGLKIDLPEVQAASTPVKDARLLVTVTRDEKILFGEKDVTSTVEGELRENARVQKESELYIRADKDARYGVVARVVAAARAANVRSLNLLVQPELEEEPEAPAARAEPVTGARVFLPAEVAVAVAAAVIVEGLLVLLLLSASNTTRIVERRERPPEVESIAVQPVLDELPLLKLGSKKARPKLPDMWVKKPPVRRYEEASAPTPKAEPVPEKIPEAKVAERDAAPPPPDAEIAKKVDEVVPTDAAPPPVAVLHAEAGAEDGVQGGTETDPLKAHVVGQYRQKLGGWFRSRFRRPRDIPCEVLRTLRASVSASVGPERTVVGWTLARPSGNPTFDEAVRATMDGIVSAGEELPPPPPSYPDLLGSTLAAGFFVPSCD
ncbi:MAG: biopolymer transporter ExbD [Deltaproteobacteria bacterium]|nr:biopolymer transporter ExbD [Deltaproteobacteria bacterium]